MHRGGRLFTISASLHADHSGFDQPEPRFHRSKGASRADFSACVHGRFVAPTSYLSEDFRAKQSVQSERGVTMARSRTKHDAVASATGSSPKSLAQPATVADSDIARRAYDRYLARGCEAGRDVEDWLQAERELRDTMSSAAA